MLIKSVLSENLGGILGGIECPNGQIRHDSLMLSEC
jgi:hypothetical protein